MSASERLRIDVQGMTCRHCETAVADALREAGAKVLRVDYQAGEALVEVPAGTGSESLAQAIRGAGYRPGAVEVLPEQPARQVRLPGHRLRSGDHRLWQRGLRRRHQGP